MWLALLAVRVEYNPYTFVNRSVRYTPDLAGRHLGRLCPHRVGYSAVCVYVKGYFCCACPPLLLVWGSRASGSGVRLYRTLV